MVCLRQVCVYVQKYFTVSGRAEAEALDFVESIKAMHRDATHNVYAYQAGEQDEIQRSSDDGEPSGTAGRPVLEVIKKANLKNTAVVVTRYFGGILLGAGGLVRAYSKAAALALQEAKIIEKIPAKAYSLTLDYALWGKLENLLAQAEYEVVSTAFMEKITVFCAVTQEAEAEFLNKLQEIGNGTITVLPVLQEYCITREASAVNA